MAATIDVVMTTATLSDCATPVRRLRDAVDRLAQHARPLNLRPLEHREWYERLVDKLVPQLTDDAFLIVAVVGGTNIGKTVVFNHIAGSRASSSSPLASGTKHPTCLVPAGFSERHELADLFPGFTLADSKDPEQALAESNTDWLFWREEASLPENLIVLDTPDIDSEARVNWERADGIRRSADVLVALLTQQKYNDAAVKEFFRKAADEDKLVMIVFNQVLLPEDEEYWPLWVGTFCEETGVEPRQVYLAPNDRRAAENNELPFYERDWPVDDVSTPSHESRSLLADLSELRFAEIKLQTLAGSIERVTDEATGIPSYLKEIAARSREYAQAGELLATHQLAEIDDWPKVPNAVLVKTIRDWWAEQREGWTAQVHGFYNALGRGLMWPVRAAQEYLDPDQVPPLEQYRQQEWAAILEAVGKVYDKLTWMSEIGNPLLQPRLEALLGGTSRAQLLQLLEEEHKSADLQGELDQLVATQLGSFREERPDYYKVFRHLDGVAAAARPATSVVLFVAGGPLGHAVVPAFAEAAGQSILHVAGDVAGGAVAAAVGETAISGTASSGVGYLEARFRKLHIAFTEQRAMWLANRLKDELLGTLPEELAAAATIGESEDVTAVRELLQEVKAALIDHR